MIRIQRMPRHLLRSTLLSLVVATGVLGAVPAVQAQVRRQSVTRSPPKSTRIPYTSWSTR
jgi:hypothetical protein